MWASWPCVVLCMSSTFILSPCLGVTKSRFGRPSPCLSQPYRKTGSTSEIQISVLAHWYRQCYVVLSSEPLTVWVSPIQWDFMGLPPPILDYTNEECEILQYGFASSYSILGASSRTYRDSTRTAVLFVRKKVSNYAAFILIYLSYFYHLIIWLKFVFFYILFCLLHCMHKIKHWYLLLISGYYYQRASIANNGYCWFNY